MILHDSTHIRTWQKKLPQIVRASRAAQGLPPSIEDARIISQIELLIPTRRLIDANTSTKRRTADTATPLQAISPNESEPVGVEPRPTRFSDRPDFDSLERSQEHRSTTIYR